MQFESLVKYLPLKEYLKIFQNGENIYLFRIIEAFYFKFNTEAMLLLQHSVLTITDHNMTYLR